MEALAAVQILSLLLCSTGHSNGQEPVLPRLTIPELQRKIQVSRHQPVCVIFRSPDTGSQLETEFTRLWEQRQKFLQTNSSDWQLSAFNVEEDQKAPLSLPKKLPSLRCYLGLARPVDYRGRSKDDALRNWLRDLDEEFSDQLPEATLDGIESIVKSHRMTLLGFSGLQKHYEAEELLLQIRDLWGDLIHVVFVHPHSPDVRYLAQKYKVSSFPAAVFIDNSIKTGYQPTVVETIKSFEFTRVRFQIFLTARYMEAVKLDQDNFEDVVLYQTKHYVPTLVLFYSPKNPVSLRHLSALQTTVADFSDHGVNLRYGLMEINSKSKTILETLVKFGYTHKAPYTVLFNIIWKKTTVVGISQYLISQRPTPSTVLSVLDEQDIPLKSAEGLTVSYQPWGYTPTAQTSQLFEGPFGEMCCSTTHNETDNNPKERSWLMKPKVKPKTSKKDATGWHDRFGSEALEARLEHIGSLPVVSGDSWEDAIERSHAPSHPFNPGGRWRGEVTKVALIVFVITDCGSCNRNMEVFEELRKAVRYIDGGSLYLVNCSSDPDICRENSVTGFPTLSAFRGLGWLEGNKCLTSTASMRTRYVRMDYHGPLMVKSVMDWFSEAAGQAVTNFRFQDSNKDSLQQQDDAQLTATVIPKMSRFLPHRSRKAQESFYSYQCFRLACERLYGQAACYVRYSRQIPQSEFEDEEQDMVVSAVEISRKDGVSASVMQLGRSLASTLHEESVSSAQHFHRPHRYNLPANLKCEDDHGACTDLLVDFTRDHARLPVTHMTEAHFHTKTSVLFHEDLPVLVALVHQDNISADSMFLETLHSVAVDLYDDLVVVTVDVDQYPAWAGQFVPRNYAATVHRNHLADSDVILSLYVYPRLCVVYWYDHHRAAFYPPPDTPVTPKTPFNFQKTEIVQFLRSFQSDPQELMVTTEHF